jgi:hypothetical protein
MAMQTKQKGAVDMNGQTTAGQAAAELPKAGGVNGPRDPFVDPLYRASAERVLGVIVLTKDGAEFKGKPEAGAFEVKRAKRTSDVRSGEEITGLLKKLFPNASFKWLAIMLLAFLTVWPAQAADSVEPASCVMTNKRSEAEVAIPGTYYKSTTLLFTNCVMHSGTTTNARQGLDGVTVLATISDGAYSSNITATAISTNLGTYWFSLNLATNFANQANVQIKITDGDGNAYLYPWKVLNLRSPLQ